MDCVKKIVWVNPHGIIQQPVYKKWDKRNNNFSRYRVSKKGDETKNQQVVMVITCTNG